MLCLKEISVGVELVLVDWLEVEVAGMLLTLWEPLASSLSSTTAILHLSFI